MTKPKLATKFARPEDSPGLLLWQLSNKWQAKQRAALKTFDLTHVQFVLLATLTYAASKDALTQKQLADYAQTDVMMTSQVIRKLEHKGLVKRTPSKLDARAFTLMPTAPGIKLVNKAIVAVESVDKNFFKLSNNEYKDLLTIMNKLVH